MLQDGRRSFGDHTSEGVHHSMVKKAQMAEVNWPPSIVDSSSGMLCRGSPTPEDRYPISIIPVDEAYLPK